MKKTTFLLMLLCSVFIAKAQKNTTDPIKSEGPKIEFVKTIHDYGTIKSGSDGSCQFVFKNTGNEPLLLTSVTASCDCTVPSWPKSPVFPGNTSTIKVVYDTKKIGMISKTIRVVSNAGNSTVELTIKGNVVE